MRGRALSVGPDTGGRGPRAVRARAALVAATACAACAACASGPRVGPALPAARPACPDGAYWTGEACAPRRGADELERGARALSEFRVEEALEQLRSALGAAPHAHATYVRIWEQLGIAHAYLGRESEAMEAFGMLLALDPGHLLSYTLSPKATFLFERARQVAAERGAPALQVTWPRGLDVSRPVPVDVEVVADPASLLSRAAVHVRVQGEQDWRAVDVELPAVGGYERVTLPAPAVARPAVLELYVVAFDGAGNEVLAWASPRRPREVPLGYDPPSPWYRRWWVLAAIGGSLAAATGATVYGLTREPPDTVGGQVGVGR